MRAFNFKDFLLLCCLVLLAACINSSKKKELIPTESISETTPLEPIAKNDCIERVIAMDDSLGKIRNNACKVISLKKTIEEYTEGLQQLDFEGCSSDFTEAFQTHRTAWREMIPVVSHYPKMRGEMHDLFDSIEKGTHAEIFKTRLDKIWSTWADVEKAMEK